MYFIVQSSPLFAQNTEAEARIQAVFIDGQREFLLGNFDRAAEKFKEVLQKDPQNDVAAFELARTFEKLNKDEEAIKSAKDAVAAEPENTWYQLFLADLYQKTNRDREAATLFENLVKKFPAYEEYYLKWAFYLVRANEAEKAIKVYDQLEKRIGVNEELTRRKHALYLGMGDQKKAVAEMEKLIAAFPANANYRHLLAGFYEQMGHLAKAEEVYKDILKINPNDTKAKLALVGNAKTSNTDAGYMANLKPIFENPNVGIDLKVKEIFTMVQKVADSGDRNLAQSALELSAILERVHPTQAKGFSISGDLYFYTDQYEMAIGKYKKTLELDPNVYLVWEQLLLAFKELDKFSEMVTESERGLDVFPNQAALHYFNGYAKGQLGKHSAAVEALEQALLMSGRNARLKFDILTRLGAEHCALKNYEASTKHFEDALKLNAKDPELLSTYALCIANRIEQIAKAKEMAALANDLAPNRPQLLDAYGMVLYKGKDYAGAKEWLSKALQYGGDKKAAILEHYGDVLFQLDSVNEAVQYWQRASDKLGGNAPALLKKIADRQVTE